MPRRASKGNNPTSHIILSLALMVGFGIMVSFMTKEKVPYRNLPQLPVIDAIENGNSLRGNTYQVEGKIAERWVKNNYEGLHLSVESNGQQYPIFIKIPKDLERPNLEREKRYSFSVEVGSGGVPLATGIQRL